MNAENRNTSNIWKLLVAVLIAAVAIQGYLMYGLYHRDRNQISTVTPVIASPGRPAIAVASPRVKPAPAPAVTTSTPGTTLQTDPDDAWAGMTGNAWDPFTEMQRMQERMSRMFDDAFGRYRASPLFQGMDDSFAFAPQMDMTENDQAYVVTMDLPGAEKSDISVNIEGQVLTVSGKTSEVSEQKQGNQVIRQERRSGQFERALSLPGPVETDKMQAKYEKGVLTVTVPKAEAKTAPVHIGIS